MIGPLSPKERRNADRFAKVLIVVACGLAILMAVVCIG